MTNKSLDFYYDHLSQPSRAVYIFLKINKIPFDAHYIDLLNKKNLTDEFAVENPFKMVPAINDAGFKLSESVAILEYLADKYKVADHWYPKDLKLRARVNQYTSWHHSNVRKFSSQYFWTTFLTPMKSGQPIDEEKLKKDSEDLNRVLNQVENIFLAKPGTYISGGAETSIGDLLIVTELQQVIAAGFDAFEDRPRLKCYVERTIETLQPVFDEAHVDIFKITKK